MLDHQLPDEEGGTIRADPGVGPGLLEVAVVRYPYASNLDEWHLLPHAARVRWATAPGDVAGADLVVLPGSKHVAADAAWLRQRGLDRVVTAAAAAGTRVLGVCGGAMLLGGEVADPAGVEGATTGLGLLPLRCEMAGVKLTTATRLQFGSLPGPWRVLEGLAVDGYEIRNGVVEGPACAAGPLVWAQGSVLATTVHGLFEDPSVVQALCGRRPPPVLDTTFEHLADAVDEHLDTALLWRLAGQ